MLDIKWIREKPEALLAALVKRGSSRDDAQQTVDEVLKLDEDRRAHLGELQLKQERRNAASKEIGNAMRSKDMTLAETLKVEVNEIKAFLSGAEQRERDIDAAINLALASIPNVPLDEVPVGKDERDNVELRKVGEVRPRPNWAKEHFEIGEALGMMDFERAARLSGSRFTVLKGQLARLERALGQFMLDLHTTEHGYTEVQPPLIVNSRTMYGTGNLPKFAEDLFVASKLNADAVKFPDFVSDLINGVYQSIVDSSVKQMEAYAELVKEAATKIDQFREENDSADRTWLIPTAEVPLTNLVREEITAQEKLPLRFTALTPCFRSEAGSAGRDTRGMLRQHQFYKVELVSITDQESSLEEHDRMTACAEEVLKRLGLPFRTIVLCTGDMGFGSRKTHDIEVWLPGQNAYREISSCSVCGDFQARRMDARYRSKEDRQNKFVHTLNGSGVAVGRALIAVLENYQNEDGSVTIPEVLRPYMGGLEKIEKA